MKRTVAIVAATMLLAVGTIVLIAQQRGGPPPPMSFFVTSAGKGDGANYGGVAGADAYCQMLGTQAGRGSSTWHAYMSTQGAGAVNARDRIGNGPWYNQKGQIVAMNVAQLHGDTVEQARLGNALGKQFSLTEKGGIVNGVGDMPNNQVRHHHDPTTGTRVIYLTVHRSRRVLAHHCAYMRSAHAV